MRDWKRSFGVLAVAAAVLLPVGLTARAQKPVTKTEVIDWTWEVRPEQADARLPNVLLLGDSITRNYFPEVQRELSGVANVYLMASSTSVGDPRLARQIQEFAAAEGVQFQVVHFNNGMHGWAYSEEEFKAAFPDFVATLRTIAPKATLIWATCAPVQKESQPGPTNLRVIARNKIAESVVKPAGIAIDDQHALMLQHQDTYLDGVHFNEVGSNLQGKQAAETIRTALAAAR